MTDRELLEKAAKAACHTIRNWAADAPMVNQDNDGYFVPTLWNPLADDGDALRLAVKLNMTMRCYMGATCAQIGVPGQANAYVEETDHSDPCAATRRAIVRAAAQAGEHQ